MIAGRVPFVGVDLGQAHDPTAVCVLDRVLTVADEVDHVTFERTAAFHYELRFLERLKLGTPYPAVVERVGDICEKLGGRPELVVDGTGVGRPVVDMLKGSRAYRLVAVQITGAGEATSDGIWWRVPKRDLVAGLVVLFQRGELLMSPRLADAAALANELTNFRVKLTASANDTYGNWRDADHDDLVLAVALAAWRAVYTKPLRPQTRMPML